MNAKTIKIVGMVLSVIGLAATGASELLSDAYVSKEIEEQVSLQMSKYLGGEK